MKLLVLGIDAVSPSILFSNLEKLPHIKKLVDQGTSGSYIGYTYGYGSRDNWISMYTGLTPEQHEIINNTFAKTNKSPRLYNYRDKMPFWQVLNEAGIKVGLWKALSTSPPEEIDGYIASGEYALEESEEDSEIWSASILFHSNLDGLQGLIKGNPPKPSMPKGPESIGFSWEQIKENPKLLLELMTDDYFKEGLVYLEGMLDYHLQNIKKVNAVEPVDLFWFYDPIFDFLSHFQMHDSEQKVVIHALEIIDEFIGELIELLKPENVLVLSDHGQLSFGDHFPNMSIKERKNAFGLANQSYFIDEHIFLPARNGGVLTASHAPEATLIGAGPLFKKGLKINNEYRTVDIYPLILELFDCEMPKGRQGYVPLIIDKENYINAAYPSELTKHQVLILATMRVYDMNAFINQYFLNYRFHQIHVIAESVNVPAYEVNPHVDKCFKLGEFSKIAKEYDKIIIPGENDKYSLNYEEYLTKKK